MATNKTATDFIEEVQAALEGNGAFDDIWTIVDHANALKSKPDTPTVFIEWVGEGIGALSDTDPTIPSVTLFAALVYPLSETTSALARKAVSAGVREIQEILRGEAGTQTPDAYRVTYHPLDAVGGINCVSADMEIEYRISI